MAQLEGLGLSTSGARKRSQAGRLHRIHRGVYAVGHPRLSVEGRWMAAVLACGHGAVLSHRSAAALWGIRPAARAKTDVTVPDRARRSQPGINVHRSKTLCPAEVTSTDAIPCTTVERTLLDLAELIDKRGLERAFEQAEVLRIFDGRALAETLARATGRRGAPILREIATRHDPGQMPTRSELEERFLAICRTADLPPPRVNTWIELGGGGVEVDFVWPRERLVVETDGHRFHGTRMAFERDRQRDQRLALAGYRVVRFTWRQLAEGPDEVGRTIRALLAQKSDWLK